MSSSPRSLQYLSRLASSAASPLSSTSAHSSLDPIQLAHMTEQCIAVNENDDVIGAVSKRDAHSLPNLVLHRAFSVFAFTPERQLILQKRSDAKITFPSLWTNTCCSHPLNNDLEMDGVKGVKRAAVRKLVHELGLQGVSEEEILPMGRYLYKAAMPSSSSVDGSGDSASSISYQGWGEHELDYAVVLRGVSASRLQPNPEEVSEVEMIDESRLAEWVTNEPQSFSPWFSLFVRHGHLSQWWKRLDEISPAPDHAPILRLN